jgi:phosphoribosyl-ATP pyrophosphohydrolase/phosphoribosyl-AMP cyclohydrolase
MLVSESGIGQVDFAKDNGLLPAIVQHARTGNVLMLGYMSEESLRATLARGRVVFFSRSRRELWEKGLTSGHHLDLIDIRTDCDRDALLVRVLPAGPTCHLGTVSCFGDDCEPPAGFLGELDAVIASRRGAAPDVSYTAKLFSAGPQRMAQKVGEEGVETALAGACQDDSRLLGESADLVYHLLVLLRGRDLDLAAVTEELRRRHRAG